MKDSFSKQSEIYAKYRPGYPPELYDFILTHVNNRSIAWDCATGNGQTATALAKYFEKVFATDISQKQIDNALNAKNIFYSLQAAEHTNFEKNTFDLVTVSQALHWFNTEKFYAEVKRVTKPGGWIAVWMYSLCNICSAIDELINEKHYRNTLGAYWDYERKYVDDCYTTLSFPFSEIKSPGFQILLHWTIDELSGYLNSWSALQKFIATNHYNPVDELMIKIKPYWEDEKMKIVFPLYLRMGQVEK